MTSFARTLTGDRETATLGRTLIHEHLSVDWGEMVGRPKVLNFEFDEMVARMTAKMTALADEGFGTLVECTPIGCGRYLDLFKAVAEQSPVRIIGSTGFFHESWCPLHPIAEALDCAALADLFIREITEGMGDTLIRAGMIKCATGEGRISAGEEKIVRAAARAHRATGCPIITHTTANSMGPEQLDIFESEGVAPAAVIISHVESVAAALPLLERGASLSIDRIGTAAFFEDEHWVQMVTALLDAGYVRQMMLSHDAAVFVYGLEIVSGEKAFDDFTYLARAFLPKLRAAGVSEAELAIMLEENPRRVLAFRSGGAAEAQSISSATG